MIFSNVALEIQKVIMGDIVERGYFSHPILLFIVTDFVDSKPRADKFQYVTYGLWRNWLKTAFFEDFVAFLKSGSFWETYTRTIIK